MPSTTIGQKTDERRDRLAKLKKIQDQGINPYPAQSSRSHSLAQVLADFENLKTKGKAVTVVGRLRAKRVHGGVSFSVLEDASGRLQIFFRKDVISQENYYFFRDLIDLGDFLEVSGTLFNTKTGEETLEVKEFKLLSKTLRPLPEKWHGLSDVEIRYRQRYLDLIANPEVVNIAKKRSELVRHLRNFFDARGFYEVETPILQPLAGGATARPFVTRHHTLDMDMYLRIAPELYLKRLVVGGLEKVYEIARCFRNEGIDHAHNPEFTQIEFYQAYSDYNDLMELTEELMDYLLDKLAFKKEIIFGQHKINFKRPYPRLTFREALKKYADFDIEKYDDQELVKTAKKMGLELGAGFGKGKILDEIYKEKVRPKLIQPVFLIDHPVELSPLAKRKVDDPRYTERFQLVLAGGYELCNAFSELNDPVDQLARFKEQEKLKKAGDEEAQSLDLDYVEALEHGLPPTAGFGMGIDRLVCLLTNSHSLKEVILFPTLRPHE